MLSKNISLHQTVNFCQIQKRIYYSVFGCFNDCVTTSYFVAMDEQSPHISRRAFNIINNYGISYHECTGISVFSLTTDILTSEYIFINL